MQFSMEGLLSGLKKGLATVDALMPVATALGAPTELVSKVTNIAGALIDTAQNVSERVAEGKVVAHSSDQAELKTILELLQAKNDELAAYIEAH